MPEFITIFLAISSLALGLAVGSFLNVAVLRGAEGKSLRGRSHCQSCFKALTVFELIPVFSYISQKGKCRSCAASLSLQYPMVESGTAIAFFFTTWLLTDNFFYLDYLVIAKIILAFVGISASLVILVSDIKYKVIPDGALLFLLPIGFIASFWGEIFQSSNEEIFLNISRDEFWYDLSAAIILFFLFASMWFFSRGTWMGFGDAKLIFATSLIIGFPASLVAFLLSFWLGSLAAIIILLLKMRGLRDQVPFGPYILLGTLLALFFTPEFIRWTNLSGLL